MSTVRSRTRPVRVVLATGVLGLVVAAVGGCSDAGGDAESDPTARTTADTMPDTPDAPDDGEATGERGGSTAEFTREGGPAGIEPDEDTGPTEPAEDGAATEVETGTASAPAAASDLAPVDACSLLEQTPLVEELTDVGDVDDPDASQNLEVAGRDSDGAWLCTIEDATTQQSIYLAVASVDDADVYATLAQAQPGTPWEEQFGDSESVVVSHRGAAWTAAAAVTSGDYAVFVEVRLDGTDLAQHEEALRGSLESVLAELDGAAS